MKFYTRDSKQGLPKSAVYPCATLTKDNWNDYGYKTLFKLTYYPRRGIESEIGDLKILGSADESRTELPDSFSSLSDDFCSLGQSISYYEAIAKLPKPTQNTLLAALRDVATQPHIAEAFAELNGFKTSLLRYSEAEKAFREGSIILNPFVQEVASISFRFTVKLKESAVPHVLDVRLGDDPNLPDRIVALIGKNGTGKTWLLGRLAASLSGDEVGVGNFEPNRPSFSRIVAMSYSAFDRFNKPKKRSFSYRYCGIYDEAGKVSTRQHLFSKVRRSIESIEGQDRRGVWDRVVKPLLGDEAKDAIDSYLFESGSEGNRTARSVPKLSSGQLVLLVTMSEMIAAIEKDSLILFDEPELHLHPNAIATLLVSLYDILITFQSYAVIATHSPLILQQIPSKYVKVFSRFGDATLIGSLPIESFGENLSIITQEVFQVNSSPSLYRESLIGLLGRMTIPEVLALFPNGLSFNAKAALFSGQPEDA